MSFCRRHLHAWAAFACYKRAARRHETATVARAAAHAAAQGARQALVVWGARSRLPPGLARRASAGAASRADAARARRLSARAIGAWRARAVARRASAGAASRADAARARRLSARAIGAWRARAVARSGVGEAMAMAAAAAAFLAHTRHLERWAGAARCRRAARRKTARADALARHQCATRSWKLVPVALRAWETDARARWARREMMVVARRRACRNLAPASCALGQASAQMSRWVRSLLFRFLVYSILYATRCKNRGETWRRGTTFPSQDVSTGGILRRSPRCLACAPAALVLKPRSTSPT